MQTIKRIRVVNKRSFIRQWFAHGVMAIGLAWLASAGTGSSQGLASGSHDAEYVKPEYSLKFDFSGLPDSAVLRQEIPAVEAINARSDGKPIESRPVVEVTAVVYPGKEDREEFDTVKIKRQVRFTVQPGWEGSLELCVTRDAPGTNSLGGVCYWIETKMTKAQ